MCSLRHLISNTRNHVLSDFAYVGGTGGVLCLVVVLLRFLFVLDGEVELRAHSCGKSAESGERKNTREGCNSRAILATCLRSVRPSCFVPNDSTLK